MKYTNTQKLQIFRTIEEGASVAYLKAMEMVDEEIEKVIKERMRELNNHFLSVTQEMKTKIAVMKPLDGKPGVPGPKGDKGDNYVLTQADKAEIAAKIQPVPNVVVEKREVVREIPIVKEVAVTDKPIEIANKLNTLEERVNMKVIKGLEKTISNIIASIRDRSSNRGGPSGGGMGNWVNETFDISSATTSVTLQYRVAANGEAILVRYQGQLLDHGVQYSITDKVVTLNFTPDDDTKLSVTYVRT